MSSNDKIHLEFPGRILLVGFGSIGQGVLPLILRHIGIAPERLTIVTAEDKGNEEAAKYGIKFVKERLTRENFRRVLNPLLGRGDFLINVSVEVSSLALIKLCWEKGAMYLDTCLEPWPGGYIDPTVPAARRTNYALREEALALRAGNARAPTAVLTHGANPGLVSHFVKQALLNIAAETRVDAGKPASRAEWGDLARRLGLRVVHIAEHDTQISSNPKQPGEFVNTWSIDGRSEEHTSELQSRFDLVCRLLLEKKKKKNKTIEIVYELIDRYNKENKNNINMHTSVSTVSDQDYNDA